MAELFDVGMPTINEHLKNIFESKELNEAATIRKFRIVQREGNRAVNRDIDFYNLDAIIAVGYRVNSHRATQFRIWSTATLKEFIIKGFVLDDERLKQGGASTRTILTSCWNGFGKSAPVNGVFTRKLPTFIKIVVLIILQTTSRLKTFIRQFKTSWNGPLPAIQPLN